MRYYDLKSWFEFYIEKNLCLNLNKRREILMDKLLTLRKDFWVRNTLISFIYVYKIYLNDAFIIRQHLIINILPYHNKKIGTYVDMDLHLIQFLLNAHALVYWDFYTLVVIFFFAKNQKLNVTSVSILSLVTWECILIFKPGKLKWIQK